MQSRAAVMPIVPLPPVASNAAAVVPAVTWHFSALGAVTDVLVDVHAAAPASASTARIVRNVLVTSAVDACPSP